MLRPMTLLSTSQHVVKPQVLVQIRGLGIISMGDADISILFNVIPRVWRSVVALDVELYGEPVARYGGIALSVDHIGTPGRQ